MPSMSASVETGVVDRFEHRVDREVERIAVDAASDLRLTDACDDGLALESIAGKRDRHQASLAVGANIGSQTSSS